MHRNNKKFLISLISACVFPLTAAHAGYGGKLPMQPLPLEKGWYVEGNIGYSRTHDSTSLPATSVNNRGVGWNVAGGYQFFRYLAGEVGYTQYGDAEQSTRNTWVATNKHYSVEWLAKAILPIPTGNLYFLNDRLRAFGKFGWAYVRARKNFSSNTIRINHSVNIYYGGGLDYAVSRNVRFVAQFNEALGNGRTGSTDLYSIGVNYMIG